MTERKIKIPTEEEKKIATLEEENAKLQERVDMLDDAVVDLIIGGM